MSKNIDSNLQERKPAWPLNVNKYTTSIYVHAACTVAQPCLTLCDPIDCNLPGSSLHGILQARILEWVAISSSRGSSWPRDRTHMSWYLLHRQRSSLPLSYLGSPLHFTSNQKRVKNNNINNNNGVPLYIHQIGKNQVWQHVTPLP